MRLCLGDILLETNPSRSPSELVKKKKKHIENKENEDIKVLVYEW